MLGKIVNTIIKQCCTDSILQVCPEALLLALATQAEVLTHAEQQMVSPFAPRGAEKPEAGRSAGSQHEASDAHRQAVPMASRPSSSHLVARNQIPQDGSDEEFLPFESHKKAGGQRPGHHASKAKLRTLVTRLILSEVTSICHFTSYPCACSLVLASTRVDSVRAL